MRKRTGSKETRPCEAKEWRCFFCDEVFTDEEAARFHFGGEMSGGAACVDPLRHDEAARMRELREAKEHAAKMQRESEAAEEDVARLHGFESELERLFGDGVRTPWQAWLKLEHWQNLDEANREHLTVGRQIRAVQESDLPSDVKETIYSRGRLPAITSGLL